MAVRYSSGRGIIGNDGTRPAKPLHAILAGVLSLSCEWSDSLGEHFDKAVGTLEPTQRLQFGCCLENGSFLVTYDGQGEVEQIQKSTQDEALISFFLKLTMELQKLGTVPAIDIAAYAKSLDSF